MTTTTTTAPPPPTPAESLAILLRSLKLPTFARVAADVAQKAEREAWSFGQYLHHLAELEVEERRRRRIERYLRDSDLPAEKTLATLERQKLPAKVQKQLPTLCEGLCRPWRQPPRVRSARARQVAPRLRHRSRAGQARSPRAVHPDVRARAAPARGEA